MNSCLKQTVAHIWSLGLPDLLGCGFENMTDPCTWISVEGWDVIIVWLRGKRWSHRLSWTESSCRTHFCTHKSDGNSSIPSPPQSFPPPLRGRSGEAANPLFDDGKVLGILDTQSSAAGTPYSYFKACCFLMWLSSFWALQSKYSSAQRFSRNQRECTSREKQAPMLIQLHVTPRLRRAFPTFRPSTVSALGALISSLFEMIWNYSERLCGRRRWSPGGAVPFRDDAASHSGLVWRPARVSTIRSWIWVDLCLKHVWSIYEVILCFFRDKTWKLIIYLINVLVLLT